MCSVHRRCVSLGCGLNICFHQNDPLFLFHGRYYLNSFQNWSFNHSQIQSGHSCLGQYLRASAGD